MSDRPHEDPPSAFIVEWVNALRTPNAAGGRALDVAMGRGRHAEVLANAGFRVFGVDWQIDAGHALRRVAGRARLRAWIADLTSYPLPADAFDLVVVTRYLQRDLFDSLRRAVVPGGVVLYETFTEAQHELAWGPRSPDHLLGALELRSAFDTFDVLFYEEVRRPEAVARLAARRRNRSDSKYSTGSDTLPGRAAP